MITRSAAVLGAGGPSVPLIRKHPETGDESIYTSCANIAFFYPYKEEEVVTLSPGAEEVETLSPLSSTRNEDSDGDWSPDSTSGDQSPSESSAPVDSTNVVGFLGAVDSPTHSISEVVSTKQHTKQSTTQDSESVLQSTALQHTEQSTTQDSESMQSTALQHTEQCTSSSTALQSTALQHTEQPRTSTPNSPLLGPDQPRGGVVDPHHAAPSGPHHCTSHAPPHHCTSQAYDLMTGGDSDEDRNEDSDGDWSPDSTREGTRTPTVTGPRIPRDSTRNEDSAGSARTSPDFRAQPLHPADPPHQCTSQAYDLIDAWIGPAVIPSPVMGPPPEDSFEECEESGTSTTSRSLLYKHVWTRGDFVLWDNRITLHSGCDPDKTFGKRLMLRIRLPPAAECNADLC